MKTILLMGATGVFGSRLANNLARVPDVSIILASRQIDKVNQLMALLRKNNPHTEYITVKMQRSMLAETLSSLKPWLVIDASGPFRGANYKVPQEALAAGCHFLDLADGRDYLKGFAAAFQVPATAKGLVALAGVSSSSALSSAAVAKLTENWQRIDTVDISITPDGVGDIGESVVRGVLSYAGKPVPRFRHGRLQMVRGWMNGHMIVVPRLGRRRVIPVDTIEAELFPQRFTIQSRVAFTAGLESRIEMASVTVLARLRSIGFLPSLSSFAKSIALGRKITKLWGRKSGGMVVKVQGLNQEGKWNEATWSLLADQAQGLNVPGLPVVAAVRMLLENKLPTGARVACGDIPLANIAAEFEPLKITTQTSVKIPERALFEDALPQRDLKKLPKIIIDFHKGSLAPLWHGRACIERSRNPISRIVGSLIGLPRAMEDAEVTVCVEREADGTERWTRVFDGQQFHSTMNRGPDNSFWEKFGLLNFKLNLRFENGKLNYPITKARCLGLPLPRFLLPSTHAFETVDEQGRFVFDVCIMLPIVGLLVHYRGWLVPKEKQL